MSKIFNTTPKVDGCTYVDTITPEELKLLWIKVEEAVHKYHCFFEEMKEAICGMEDYCNLVMILN